MRQLIFTLLNLIKGNKRQYSAGRRQSRRKHGNKRKRHPKKKTGIKARSDPFII